MKLQKMSVDDEGEPKPLFSIASSTLNKRLTAKIIREDKDYDYVHHIMRKTVKRVSEKKKASKKAVGSDSYQASPFHLMNDQIVTRLFSLHKNINE